MDWTQKVLRSGAAALVVAALVVSVSPASAANEPTGLTADDVSLVKDIEPGPGDSFPRELTVFGDRVLFGAQDSVVGFELWVTDGTPTGTRLVKDINPGLPSGDGPSGFMVFGDRVLFTADDGVHGIELWVTDGTAAGTNMVKDINPGLPGGLRYGGDFTVLGDRVLFTANSGAGTDDYELWVTDGTTTGTVLVKDINPGPEGGWPAGFAVFGSEALFTADDGVNGAELWVTDGTATGTRLIKDVRAGSVGTWLSGFTVFGDLVLFEATDGESPDLWITDGTTAGTKLLKDFPPGPRDDRPGRFTVFGDRALFAASDGVSGRDLWVTDGTTAGTRLLFDVVTGLDEGQPGGLTVFGDRVLFTANDGLGGRALWSTDGTAGGTVLIKDLDPTDAGHVEGLTVFGDQVLFSGTDSHGTGEVWVTDGTPAGTELLKDINPTGDGFASGFTVFGDQVLFTADDGVHGTELWSITTGLWARIDDQLTRLYQAAYGRSPDPAGLDYWTDRYRSGSSLLEIATSFIASAEFEARNGSQPTHAHIVAGLFQNVLGRAGDQASRTYWIGRLDAGASRAEVLIAFSESPQNVARTSTIAAFTSSQSKVVRLYGSALVVCRILPGSAFGPTSSTAGVRSPLSPPSSEPAPNSHNDTDPISTTRPSSVCCMRMCSIEYPIAAAWPIGWLSSTPHSPATRSSSRSPNRRRTSTARAPFADRPDPTGRPRARCSKPRSRPPLGAAR